MTGFSAAAAERCALAICARPAAASSPAKRQQQQSASLRRSSGSQRHPSTLAACRPRGPLVVPRAVATSADRASPDLVGKFTLDSNSELQVAVNPAPQGLVSEISLEVTNTRGSLILHWGVLHPDKRDWILPSRRPDGTAVYKNRALRTPFVKSGDNSTLRIEIDDPAAQAIEFLIFDETQNKWFKNNGQNFQIQLQSSRHQGNGASGASSSATSTLVPEDLVQIQAYLRWERKGKQSYNPEQEKEEYEAARAELIEELNRGVSLEKLRAKLTKTPEAPASDETKSPASRMPADKIPEDLVQVQAYIRWEKVGKPNYPPEKQLVEFEEARKELQAQVDKGISFDQLRQKILKGNIESKVSKQLKNKKYFSVERIWRKKRDIMQLLSKHKHTVMEEKVEVAPKQPTVFYLFTESLHEKDAQRSLMQHADRIVIKGRDRTLPCPFPKIVLLSDHHWFDSIILIK